MRNVRMCETDEQALGKRVICFEYEKCKNV